MQKNVAGFVWYGAMGLTYALVLYKAYLSRELSWWVVMSPMLVLAALAAGIVAMYVCAALWLHLTNRRVEPMKFLAATRRSVWVRRGADGREVVIPRSEFHHDDNRLIDELAKQPSLP